MPQQPVISVFGLGYVGCVTAACFADLDFRVIGVDVDARKVRAIRDGQSPFYEPGLEPLIKKHVASGLLSATDPPRRPCATPIMPSSAWARPRPPTAT